MPSFFFDDFETYFADNTAGIWDSISRSGATATSSTNHASSGSRSLRIYSSQGFYWVALSVNVPNQTTVFNRTKLFIDSAKPLYGSVNNMVPIWRFMGTAVAPQLTLGVDTSSRVLKLARGAGNGTIIATGTTVLSYDSWYAIDFNAFIANSGGTVDISIGGVPEITYTGDTQNAASADIVSVDIGILNGSRCEMYWDDFELDFSSFTPSPPVAPSDLSAIAIASNRVDLTWIDNS